MIRIASHWQRRCRMLRSSIFTIGLVSLFITMNTYAYVFVAKHYVYSPAPEPKNCYDVDAHWESDNVWAGPQTVCVYEDRPEGTKLVSNYWICPDFTSSGICKTWHLKPGYWLDPPPPKKED